MGTTATALALLPSGALVAHVGDSRAYRVRGDRIEQLTFDHSLVWEIRAAGNARDAEVPAFVSKNIITRSLGPNAAVQVDLEGPHALEAGDRFLLCSDGLSGQVSDDEIGITLASLPPAEAVQALVDLANMRGGPDNITAIVVHVLGSQTANTSAAGNDAEWYFVIRPKAWALGRVDDLGRGAIGGGRNDGRRLCARGGAAGSRRLRRSVDGDSHPRGNNSADDGESRRFGRGPYVTAACTPTADFVARLAAMNQQLRDSTTNEKWPVDWLPFERHLVDAEAARQLGNVGDAVRSELRAMGVMMAQLRQLRDAASDAAE